MKNLCLLLVFVLFVFSCNRQDKDSPEPTDFGYLSMNISVTITSEPANGRVAAVPTDDWKVTIFDASDDSEEISFDPYSSAPAEIQLPTGEYYIEAHSNNLVEAAFENPYYFGRSDNFTIDKEELETVDVDTELANSKVAINYSSNVTNTFKSYSGEVTVVSSGTSLAYVQGETREGYFVAEPLSVVVDLSYTKQDGSLITRQFTADIDAEPKTLYNINVDASLEDGEIVININVDETFETVDVELSDNDDITPPPGCYLVELQNIEDTDIEYYFISYNAEGKIATIDIPDNDSDDINHVFTYDVNGLLTSVDADGRKEEFVYLGQLPIERMEYRDYGSGLEVDRRVDFSYNQGNLETLQSFNYQSGTQQYVLNESETFLYANNMFNYLPERIIRYNNLGTVQKVIDYTYDNNPNPLFELGLWACDDCIDYEDNMYSANNITRMEFKPSISQPPTSWIDVTYQYNANNYPTSAEFVWSDGVETETYTINYIYACY